jgi:hypothetical protein
VLQIETHGNQDAIDDDEGIEWNDAMDLLIRRIV